MGKPHPIALRARVVTFVEEGHSHRKAARHFRVSPRFVNNMMILQRSSGSLAPARKGQPPGSKLSAHGEWINQRVSGHGEVTLDELCVEPAERGVEVHRATVGRFLHRLGLSKKSLRASEQRRPEIAKARDLWIRRRKRFFNKALARLIFVDETSTNTRLTKRTGWSRKGRRFVAYAPFGKWKTQTFIAGLRCYGLTAPFIVDAP
jgi:transposase